MKSLTMMVGPPGSGKSTIALSRTQKNCSAYINQDSQGKRHRDDFLLAVNSGIDVIVDRMNFSKKQRSFYIEKARENGYSVHVVSIYCPRMLCLSRCLSRQGHETIRDQKSADAALDTFFSGYEHPSPEEYDTIEKIVHPFDAFKRDCVVIDLDGTMCNIDHRLHYVKHENKKENDWKKFFSEIPGDSVNEWCREIHERFFDSVPIVFCSGRSEEYRGETDNWLKRNGIGYRYLFMRPSADSRSDYIVKENILDFEILPRYNPLFFIDDRKQVVDMWRRRGFVCLQCAEGDF